MSKGRQGIARSAVMAGVASASIVGIAAVGMLPDMAPEVAYASHENTGLGKAVAIGDQKYDTIQDALDSARPGATLRLLRDVDIADGQPLMSRQFSLWIDQDVTIDGDGHVLTVGGRGIGVSGRGKDVAVTFKDIVIKNVGDTNGRCINTRGGIGSLTLEDAVLTTAESTYAGYLQPLTIGGKQDSMAKVRIVNSQIVASDNADRGYAVTMFNPVDMTIEGSTLKGWGCLNLKGRDSSAGSRGSRVSVHGSCMLSTNGSSGDSRPFALAKLEDDDIRIDIVDSNLAVTGSGGAQAIISCRKPNHTGTQGNMMTLGLGNVVTLSGDCRLGMGLDGDSNKLVVSGGTFSQPVPSDFLPDGMASSPNGMGGHDVVPVDKVIEVRTDKCVYDGSEQDIKTHIKMNGTSLREGTDYAVTLSEATEAGTHTAVAHGLGEHGFNAEFSYEISPCDIREAQVSVASVTYDGNAQEPKLTVKHGGVTLVEGRDFAVCGYSDNTDAGTGTVRIKGTGNFAEERECRFAIDAADLSRSVVKVDGTTLTTGNRKVTPIVTSVRLGNMSLSGDDYSIEWLRRDRNRVTKLDAAPAEAGAYVMRVTPVDRRNIAGSQDIDFVIEAAAASVTIDGETTNYASLLDALAAVPEGNRKALVKVLSDCDIEGNAGITIGTRQDVTLDLNGHAIQQTLTEAGESFLVMNRGTLVIRDDSKEADGKLLSMGDGMGARDFRYGNCVIKNAGNLTIKRGVVECQMGAGACYAIDNDSTDADAVVTMSGGTIRSDRVAIRQHAGATPHRNAFDQSDGVTVGGNAGIWVQLTDAHGDTSEVTTHVSGGTLRAESPSGYAWYDFAEGESAANAHCHVSGGRIDGRVFSRGGDIDISEGRFSEGVTSHGSLVISGGTFEASVRSAGRLTISDGTFDGYVHGDGSSVAVSGGSFKDSVYAYGKSVDISEGVFDGQVLLDASTCDDITVSGGTYAIGIRDVGNSPVGYISGGTFADEPAAELVGEGRAAVCDGDGSYGIGTAVAGIGTTGYATLQAAVSHAKDGETVRLLPGAADGNGIICGTGLTLRSGEGKSVTIDLNGLTYDVDDLGDETDETTPAVSLGSGNAITLCNGAVTSDKVATLVRCCCDLTLENLTLDGGDLADGGRTLSVGNGRVSIGDGTSIDADADAVALSIRVTSHYPDGVQVEVSDGAVIGGDVEYGIWDMAPETNKSMLSVTGGRLDGSIRVDSSLKGAVQSHINVSGGEFRDAVPVEMCADGYIPDYVANDHGLYGVKPGTIIARNDAKGYETLAEAVADTERGTVTLLRSTSGEGIAVGVRRKSKVTIDLNGNTYTATAPAATTADETAPALYLGRGSTVTIKGGSLTTTGDSGVYTLVRSCGTLTLDSVSLDGVRMPGSRRHVLSTGRGSTLVKDSSISAKQGDVAIDVRSDGSDKGNAVTVRNSNLLGDVEIGSTNVPEEGLSLSLESGTLSGVIVDAGLAKGTTVNVTKSDASFAPLAPSGYCWHGNGNGTSSMVRTAARIGEREYATLGEAVASAEDGDTIKLAAEAADENGIVHGNGVVISTAEAKSVTIDFSGLTYDIVSPSGGKTKGNAQPFHFESGGDITLCNGAITSGQASMLVQSYCDLTLENIVLDGTHLLDRYVLSNNNGHVLIGSGTTINAKDGGAAFDVCVTDYYPDGTQVEVTDGATVNGDIDYGVWGMVPETNKSTLVITGGTVNGVVNMGSDLDEASSSNVTISGGHFKNEVPAEMCTEGYIPDYAEQGNGTYSVKRGTPIVQSGRRVYGSVGEAIADADTHDGGGKVSFLDDVQGEQVSIGTGTKVTLDLQGHVWTPESLAVDGGSLDVRNGMIATTVDVYGSPSGGSRDSSILKVEPTASVSATPAVMLRGAAESVGCYGVRMDIGGTLEGGLQVMGDIHEGDAVISVNDGAQVTGNDAGISLDGVARVVVNGGASVEGPHAGIEARAGSLKVMGGAITGTGSLVDLVTTGLGATSQGAGIAIGRHPDMLPLTVDICGGRIEGGAYALQEVTDSDGLAMWSPDVAVSVSGGTLRGRNGALLTPGIDGIVSGGKFSHAVPIEDCADGYIPAWGANDDGMYQVVRGHIVAHIGDVGYPSVQQAIDAAVDGDTIMLDGFSEEGVVSEAGINVPSGKRLSIDLCGKAYVAEASRNRSDEESEQAFLVSDEADVTLRNGTVAMGSLGDSGACIKNNGNLTLEGIAFSGEDSHDQRAIATGHGVLRIGQGTSIEADVAVDMRPSGPSPCDSHVIVDEGAVVTGNIIYAGTPEDRSMLTVAGGTIDGAIRSEVPMSSDVANSHVSVTGGRLREEVTADMCPDGYLPVYSKDSDGFYGVKKGVAVAQVGTRRYESVAEALSVVKSMDGKRGTVTLLADASEETLSLNSGTDVTLDLDGHTLKATFLYVLNGSLRVEDGTVIGTTYVYGLDEADSGMASRLVLAADATIRSDGCGIILNGLDGTGKCYDATIDINGDVVGAVWVMSQVHEGNSAILVNDGARVSGNNVGIAMNGLAKTVVNDGAKVTGTRTGIEVRAGGLVVDGGIICGCGALEVTPNTVGITTEGVGIAVAQHTSRLPISVDVAKGHVSGGAYAIYESNPQGNPPEDIDKVSLRIAGGIFEGVDGSLHAEDIGGFVSGGAFSHPVPEACCAEGHAPVGQPDDKGLYAVVENAASLPDDASEELRHRR